MAKAGLCDPKLLEVAGPVIEMEKTG